MHVAAAKGNEKACKFLLERGASPNAIDRFGYTPMTYAVRSRSATPEFIRLLKEYGATLSPVETTRAREANHAAMQGKIGQLKLYKEAGMTLQVRNIEPAE